MCHWSPRFHVHIFYWEGTLCLCLSVIFFILHPRDLRETMNLSSNSEKTKEKQVRLRLRSEHTSEIKFEKLNGWGGGRVEVPALPCDIAYI